MSRKRSRLGEDEMSIQEKDIENMESCKGGEKVISTMCHQIDTQVSFAL